MPASASSGFFPSSGRVQKVYVTTGSAVHLGDPIMQLDARHLLLRKHELETLIHSTELNTTEDARSPLRFLYRELQQLQLDVDRLTLTSPVDGKILSLASMYPGKTFQAGTAVGVVVEGRTEE